MGCLHFFLKSSISRQPLVQIKQLVAHLKALVRLHLSCSKLLLRTWDSEGHSGYQEGDEGRDDGLVSRTVSASPPTNDATPQPRT